MTMRRSFWPALAVVFGGAALITAVGAQSSETQRSVPSVPERLVEMRHHFLQVTLIYEAVIRGDVGAIREPALELATLPTPPELPATAAPFVEVIRAAGRQAAVATRLDAAAAPVASMLSQCGECHRAAGVFPAPSTRAYPDVGGVVGHMLEHQRAADEMLQGLLVPSDTLWRNGADRLRTATLSPSELPPDPQLTSAVRQAEADVHALANRAAAATTPAERADVYVSLATTCARCHGLHEQIWGPRTPAN